MKTTKTVTLAKGFDLMSFEFYTNEFNCRRCRVMMNDKVHVDGCAWDSATDKLGRSEIAVRKAAGWVEA